MSTELDVLHRVLFDFDPFGISPGVEDSLDAESGPGLRRADEIDDGFIIHQWTAAPVQTDEREEAMFDLVPLLVPGG